MGSIVKRQPKGSPQPYYYYHETYRVLVDTPDGRKSKVKSKDTYLGTAKQVLEKIQEGQRPQAVDKKQFGLAMAALSQAEEIGLVEVIDRLVPKRRQGYTVGQYILVAVLNKIVEPTSRNGIRDWLNKTVLPERLGIDPERFTSQNFWDHFDLILSEKELKQNKERLANGQITEDELFNDEVIAKVEKGVWENVIDRLDVPLDAVFYDTTNFYSFLDVTTPSYLARTGYNKHGRHNLRQVNLGMAMTREGSLPLMHLLAHGRMHDAKLFPHALSDLVTRFGDLTDGTEELAVVFDKGNNSEANIAETEKLGVKVVGSLVPSHHKDLTGVRLARYDEIVDGRPVYVTTKEVFGLETKVATVYNEQTYRRQKHRLRERVDQLRAQVRQRFLEVKERSKPEIEAELEKVLWGKEHRRYLKVSVEGRRYKRLKCRIDLAVYHAKLRTLGKTIVFTTDLLMPVEQMVRLYFGKNDLEAQFKQMNDPDSIAFRPRYHWTDTKIKVYALICVLALLVLQLMNYRAKRAGLSMSNTVLRTELADIEEVVMVYSLTQVDRQITRLSSVQEQLWEIFDLSRYAAKPSTTTMSLRSTG